MTCTRAALAALMALGLSLGSALAQDATPAQPRPDAQAAEPQPATPAAEPATPGVGFDTGQEVTEGNKVGQDYVVDTKGDWEVRCVHTADGFDPCRVYQLLKDEHGNSVAEVAMVALDAGEAAAGATVVTPLETLLTAQLTLAIDGGKAKRYPFSWCAQVGCVSRIGLTAAELANLKKGAKATVTIVPVAAPDQQVNLTVSLTGFTAAFDAMAARNADTKQRAEAAQKATGNDKPGN